jgi:hypothetical protein
VVDIEGCEGFVVEQRKRSLAEESRQYSGISLGQPRCQWSAAVSFVNEVDLIVNSEYLNEHIADANEGPNFVPGKLCWAKKHEKDWWPAMIVDPNTKAKQQRGDIFHTVRFFVLDETKDVSSVEILPYLPYYEEMGHDRLQNCGNCEHNAFVAALKLSISVLGLKTIGQALQLSRSGVQKLLNTNCESYTAQKRLKSSGWTPPDGWKNAQVDEIDGFVILAKDDRLITSPEKVLPSPDKPVDPEDQEATASSFKDSYRDQHNIKMKFYLDEIVGGIVSWCADSDSTSKLEPLQTFSGVVVAINPAGEAALVRTMPLDPGNFLEEAVGSSIYTHYVGSSFWIPLNALNFVAARPNVNDLVDFQTTLSSRMRTEMRLYSSRREAADVTREHNTVELAFDDSLCKTAVDVPTPQSPYQQLVSYQKKSLITERFLLQV